MNAFADYELKQTNRRLPKLPDNVDYLCDIKLEKPKFLIAEIMPANCLSAIVGPSYTYKTFLVLDMCLSVSAGTPFHEHDVEAGTVIYVNGEGRYGIMTRINAWCQSRSLEPKDLPFILSKSPINLRDMT